MSIWTLTQIPTGRIFESATLKIQTDYSPGVGPRVCMGEVHKELGYPTRACLGSRDGLVTRVTYKPTKTQYVWDNGPGGAPYAYFMNTEQEFRSGPLDTDWTSPDGHASDLGHNHRNGVIDGDILLYWGQTTYARPDVPGLILKARREWRFYPPPVDKISVWTEWWVDEPGPMRYWGERWNIGSAIATGQGGRWAHNGGQLLYHTLGRDYRDDAQVCSPRTWVHQLTKPLASRDGSQNITAHVRYDDVNPYWDSMALVGSPTDPDIVIVVRDGNRSVLELARTLRADPRSGPTVSPHRYHEGGLYREGWARKAPDGTWQEQYTLATFLMDGAGKPPETVGAYWGEGLRWRTGFDIHFLPADPKRAASHTWLNDLTRPPEDKAEALAGCAIRREPPAGGWLVDYSGPAAVWSHTADRDGPISFLLPRADIVRAEPAATIERAGNLVRYQAKAGERRMFIAVKEAPP